MTNAHTAFAPNQILHACMHQCSFSVPCKCDSLSQLPPAKIAGVLQSILTVPCAFMQPDHPSDELYPSRVIVCSDFHECGIACGFEKDKIKKLILDAFLGNQRARKTERAFPECVVATAFFVVVPGQEPVPWNRTDFMKPKPGYEHFVMELGNEIQEAIVWLEADSARRSRQNRAASPGHGLPSSSNSP
jgi:hypothetical protein